MGQKYTSNTISGYNSTPPADDGSTTEANKVKWATVKSKLTDPIKTLSEANNSDIATALDYGPVSVVSTTTTLGVAQNNQFINLSGAAVPTLGDAATLGAGWFCDVKNTGSNVITMARATPGDTINDVSADDTLNPLDYIRYVVNSAANGFDTASSKIATQAEANAGTRSDVAITPKTMIAAVPRGYIYGLKLSNDTDTDHDIAVAVGVAADSGGDLKLDLSSVMTKQIDASWASGDDAGGLSSSLTVANTTWYNVFLVTIAGAVDVLFDTSATCANGVADHSVTSYRRIGSVLTDGSANILPGEWNGDDFEFDTVISEYSGAVATTRQLLTVSVPSTTRAKLILAAHDDADGSVQVWIRPTHGTDVVPGATNAQLQWSAGGADGSASTEVNVWADGSSQVAWRGNDSGDNVRITVLGYKDLRGQ